MAQNNNDDYSKYFEVLDASIDKLISTKKQYLDNSNRVNSVLFRKQLLELKTVLGQSRQDVLKVNKSKKPAKIEVEVEKVETHEPQPEVSPEVSPEVLPEVSPEVTPEVSTPEVSTPEVSTPEPEVKLIAVVDTEKNKRKARIQPNKKPRQ